MDVVEKRVSSIRNEKWDTDDLKRRRTACREEIRALTETRGDVLAADQRRNETMAMRVACDAVSAGFVSIALAFGNANPECSIAAVVFGVLLIAPGLVLLVITGANHQDANDIVGTISPDWMRNARLTHKTDFPWKSELWGAIRAMVVCAFFAYIAAYPFGAWNLASGSVGLVWLYLAAKDIATWMRIAASLYSEVWCMDFALMKIIAGLNAESTTLAYEIASRLSFDATMSDPPADPAATISPPDATATNLCACATPAKKRYFGMMVSI